MWCPFDGEVTEGEAMVNQASLTGEARACCRKRAGATVYAGTVLEEGETDHPGHGRQQGTAGMSSIVSMIEESERLKSGLESKAEHLADRAGALYPSGQRR